MAGEPDRKFSAYRFTFDQTGPVTTPQNLPRTIDDLTIGDVSRALIEPSLGLILHNDVLKNITGEGFWDGVQRLRMLETEFRNIQQIRATRGAASTYFMTTICFGRKAKASVDLGRLLTLKFFPIIADVALLESAAPALVVCLVRVWQQAGLAPPGNWILQPEKLGIEHSADFMALFNKLAAVDVVGPKTAQSIGQMAQPFGTPFLRSIEWIPDSTLNKA